MKNEICNQRGCLISLQIFSNLVNFVNQIALFSASYKVISYQTESHVFVTYKSRLANNSFIIKTRQFLFLIEFCCYSYFSMENFDAMLLQHLKQRKLYKYMHSQD